MAGVKRASKYGHDGPSKIARTNPAPLKTLGMIQGGSLDTKTANEYVQRYNHLLPFAAKDDHIFRSAHQEMLDAKAEIERILSEASTAVSKQLDRMLTVCASELPTATRVRASHRAFERGDIMTLNLSDFKDMLDYVRLIDAVDYVAHLRGVFLHYHELSRSDQELPCNYYEFLHRIYLSMERLLLFPDAAVQRSCFAFNVVLQTTVFDDGRLVRHLGYPTLPEFDRQMIKVSDFFFTECLGLAKVDGVYIESSSTYDQRRCWYWNTAAAWREMWLRFSSHGCELLPVGELRDCMHRREFGLLQSLLEQAHDETRRLCNLAAGRELPVELVDLIHEYTLLAEGIPLDRAVAALETREGNSSDGSEVSADDAEDSSESDSDGSEDGADDAEDSSESGSDTAEELPVLHPQYRKHCMRCHDRFGDWDAQ